MGAAGGAEPGFALENFIKLPEPGVRAGNLGVGGTLLQDNPGM